LALYRVRPYAGKKLWQDFVDTGVYSVVCLKSRGEKISIDEETKWVTKKILREIHFEILTGKGK
jgi:hypothetical protein